MEQPAHDATPSDERREYEFDAFISYSRIDATFAAALEIELERYVPPRGAGLPRQHLNVFRDQNDMIGPEYHTSVDYHLNRSRRLIVICSPDARASVPVNDEIERFCKGDSATANRLDDVIPILYRGRPNNETSAADEDLAFPEALCDRQRVPLAVDYRGFHADRDHVRRTPFESSWYTLLANLYGTSRSLIETRDRRRQSRRRRMVTTATLAIAGILAVAAIIAIMQRNVALDRLYEANHNLSRVFEAQGKNASDIEAWLFAAAALRQDLDQRVRLPQSLSTLNATGPLAAAFREAGRLNEPWQAATHIAVSNDGNLLALGHGTEVSLWNLARGEATAMLRPVADNAGTHLRVTRNNVVALRFDAAQNAVVATTGEGAARWWGAAGEQRLLRPPAAAESDGFNLAAFSQDGSLWATATTHGRVVVYNTVDAAPVSQWTIGVEAWTLAFVGANQIAATDGGNTVEIRNARTGERTTQLEAFGDIRNLAASADGSALVAGAANGTVTLWSLRNTANVHPRQLLAEQAFAKVYAVALSPDGRHAAAATSIQVFVWSLDSVLARTASNVNTPVAEKDTRLTLDVSVPLALAFRPGMDQLVVTSGGDVPLQLFDLATGQETARLPGGPLSVQAIAAAPVGDLVAAADYSAVWLYNSRSGTLVGRLPVDAGTGPMAFDSYGKHLITADNDGDVTIWNVATLNPVAVTRCHDKAIRALAIASDGKTFLTATDVEVSLWNLATKELLHTLPLEGRPMGVFFAYLTSPRVVEANDTHITVKDVRDGREIARREFQTSLGAMMVADADGDNLLLRDTFGQPVVWSTFEDTLKNLDSPASHHSGEPGAFHPRHREVAIIDHGRVQLRGFWSRETNLTLNPGSSDTSAFRFDDVGLSGDDHVTALAYTADGRQLVTGTRSGAIQLWSLAEPWVLHRSRSTWSHVTFDGPHRLIAAGRSGTLTANLATGESTPTSFDSDGGSSVALRGREVVRSAYGAVTIHDAMTGESTASLAQPDNTGKLVTFALDHQGRYAAGAPEYPAEVLIWERGTAKPVHRLQGLRATHLTFAPDGMLLAAARDSTIHEIDPTSGSSQNVLPVIASARQVVVAPDAKRLATVGFDGALRLIERAGGQLLWQHPGDPDDTIVVQFHPSGAYLAVSAGTVCDLLDTNTGEVLAQLRFGGLIDNLSFNPEGTTLAAVTTVYRSNKGLVEQRDLRVINDYLTDHQDGAALRTVLRASEYLIGARDIDGAVPALRTRYLTPVRGYRFPEPRDSRSALLAPRDPGQPIFDWLLEGRRAPMEDANLTRTSESPPEPRLPPATSSTARHFTGD